jgi:hypothetical protein
MVSAFRMKSDVLGQSILFAALALLYCLHTGQRLTQLMLILLAIWQTASALHLYHSYRYVLKINYLRTIAILTVSLPIWFHFIGKWAYLPVIGLLLWYFIQTWRDMFVVLNRPKSFWDL